MEIKQIVPFKSKVLPLPDTNIDTDQITPARFLKSSRAAGGYGDILFYDWRYDAAGEPRPESVFNDPERAGATIAVAGDNFGCGSSRETAVWALREYGIEAVISTSFGDIFRNNSLKNGLLPIAVEEAEQRRILSLAQDDPRAEIEVDLAAQRLTLPDGEIIEFPFDAFFKDCLLRGLDQMGYLLEKIPLIESYEAARPVGVSTLV